MDSADEIDLQESLLSLHDPDSQQKDENRIHSNHSIYKVKERHPHTCQGYV